MKHWKQVLALLLSGAMALSLFACNTSAAPTGSDDSPDASSAGGFWDFLGGLFGGGKESVPPSAAVSGDPAASASPEIVADLTKPPLAFAAGLSAGDVLLTVNGEEIPADLMLYWLNYNCYVFMYQYGLYGLTLSDYGGEMLDQAVSLCASEALLRQKAAELGCLPTDAQVQEARDQIAASPDTIELFKSGYGLTDSSIEYLFLADAYYNNMLAAVTHEPTDQELAKYLDDNKIYRVKHILLKTVDDNRQPLPDDQIAAKRSKAEDLLSQLQGVSADGLEAKFDELMMANSEDNPQNNPDGYIAGPDLTMVEPFETASLALKDGETSGIVETEFGYHIILRLPIPEESLTGYRNDFRAAALNDQAAQWREEAEIVRSDALTGLDVADFYARMNAYQQALEEKNAPAESKAVG